MMPPLMAEEALQDVDRLRVGTAVAKPAAQRDHLARWRSAIRTRGASSTPAKATPERLHAAGIGMRHVRRDG